jgi:hypothetical protein
MRTYHHHDNVRRHQASLGLGESWLYLLAAKERASRAPAFRRSGDPPSHLEQVLDSVAAHPYVIQPG